MQDVISSILVSVVGFVVGSLLMIVIGSMTARFFVRRIIREVFSDETKDKASKWFQQIVEDSMKNGLGETIRDEKVKKIIEEILETAVEKIRKVG